MLPIEDAFLSSFKIHGPTRFKVFLTRITIQSMPCIAVLQNLDDVTAVLNWIKHFRLGAFVLELTFVCHDWQLKLL